MKALMLCLALATSAFAGQTYKESDYKTSLTSVVQSDGSFVSNSKTYKLVGSLKNQSDVQKAEAIGKKIRQEYYQNYYEVEGFSYEDVSLEVTLDALATSTAEFNRLTNEELSELATWYKETKVSRIILMSLTTDYMSGTGIEENYIFIPSKLIHPVLVVNKQVYAE